MNRIRPLFNSVRSSSAEYNMRLLLGKMTPSGNVPQQDKYYTFIYKAKTRGVRYDQHPFIVCTTLHPWGFTGFNFHWNDYRRYSWREVFSNVYEITEEEVEDMKEYPIARFKTAQ